MEVIITARVAGWLWLMGRGKFNIFAYVYTLSCQTPQEWNSVYIVALSLLAIP